tara:strand:- start:1170 stop:1709 length:540 start_codon:yes stop_codon:yes gene_type:complete
MKCQKGYTMSADGICVERKGTTFLKKKPLPSGNQVMGSQVNCPLLIQHYNACNNCFLDLDIDIMETVVPSQWCNDTPWFSGSGMCDSYQQDCESSTALYTCAVLNWGWDQVHSSALYSTVADCQCHWGPIFDMPGFHGCQCQSGDQITGTINTSCGTTPDTQGSSRSATGGLIRKRRRR